MSFEGYLIALAIILIAIDIFISSDVPTYISYILFSIVLSINLPFHFMYRILAGIVIWFLLLILHYYIWKKLISVLINKFISPERRAAGVDTLIGGKGKIAEIEGKKFVKINEELFPYHSDVELSADSQVKIVGNRDGFLIIECITDSNP